MDAQLSDVQALLLKLEKAPKEGSRSEAAKSLGRLEKTASKRFFSSFLLK